MPKRICMVAYTHYRSDARPRREAEALAERGDELDFLSLSSDGDEHSEVLNGVHVIELPARRYRGGSTIQYLRSYGRFFAQAMARLTARHLRKRYDVVYFHTMPDFIVFAGAPVKMLGAKVVLDLHDTMPELYQSKFKMQASHPLIRGLELQEQLACKFADRLVCVHEPHKQLLVSRGAPADKITVLLNIPDPRIFGGPRPRAPASRPRLVYHGTVAERLGLDVALAAFAEVLDKVPEARFEIIGTGDHAPRIHEVIGQLGLQASVLFTDKHFKVDQVPALIDGATLGVIPNKDDPATRWMLPVKLLEYVYLGIPAVAPRLPVIQHYFGEDDVGLYTPGDAASLAEAMLRLLGDRARRQRLAANAARFSEANGWGALKQRLFDVIDN